MKTALLRTVACVAALALPGPALASVERFALVIGANDGGSGRARLKYAVADAERFVQVLHDLGGVDPARAIVLKQPTPARIHEAFEQLRTRLAAAGAASADTRTEALVYYSGHADQAGLLLGDDRISYRSFRESMDGLPADVRIGVIDACASGAITRLKGGRVRPPFMVDAANRMRGHAFLTSSSAHEAAQESDRIASSFFTHYLVSGLRGAADSSGEGTVTLGEAYQFAFRETLGRTAETRAGAQHPAYDLNLSGTGDVVITDLRQTSARLVLSEELGGRCFIRDAEQRLVVEVMKPAGRRIELGLAPGRHEVRCQEKDEARVARPTLEEGRPVVLAAGDFSPGAVDRAQARGQAEDARGLDGRGRLDVTAGMGNDLVPRFGAVGYSRWVSPKLALTFNVGSRGGWTSWNDQIEERNEFGTFTAGLRRYTSDASRARFNPFLEAGTGFFVRSADILPRDPFAPIDLRSSLDFEPVLWAGLGLDVRLGRSFTLGTRVRHERVGRFAESPNMPADISQTAVSISFGFLLGGGKKP